MTHCLTLVLQPRLSFPYPLCLPLRHLLLLAFHHSSLASSSTSLASLPPLSSSWHLELARHRLPTPLPPRFCTPSLLRSFGPQHNTPPQNATWQSCSLQGPKRLYRHGPVWSSAAGCLWVSPFARGATSKSALLSTLPTGPLVGGEAMPTAVPLGLESVSPGFRLHRHHLGQAAPPPHLRKAAPPPHLLQFLRTPHSPNSHPAAALPFSSEVP